MPLTSYPIVTLDYIKTEFIEFREGFTEKDTLITNFIALATKQLETATGRSFTKQARTEILDARNTSLSVYDFTGNAEEGIVGSSREQILRLKGLAIDTGETFEIRYDPNRLFDTPGTVVPSTDYYIDDELGRVYLRHPTSKTPKSIKVTYTAGYEAAGSPLTLQDSIPEDIKQACVYQTMFLYNTRNLESINAEDDRSDGGAGSIRKIKVGGLTPESYSLIAPYKILRTGRN